MFLILYHNIKANTTTTVVDLALCVYSDCIFVIVTLKLIDPTILILLPGATQNILWYGSVIGEEYAVTQQAQSLFIHSD